MHVFAGENFSIYLLKKFIITCECVGVWVYVRAYVYVYVCVFVTMEAMLALR